MYEYRVKVVQVYDGDSIKCAVKLGFGVRLGDIGDPKAFRLNGIDTPEVRPSYRTEPDENIRALHAQAGKVVRDWLRERILGKNITARTYKPDPGDKYGRYLADMYLVGPESINAELVKLGYANAYDGGTKPRWTEEALLAIIASVEG